MKSLLIICLALAVFAFAEIGAKAQHDLRHADSRQQEQINVEADNVRANVDLGIREEVFRTNDKIHANEQADNDENDDDNDNGDEDYGAGDIERVWDAVEMG